MKTLLLALIVGMAGTPALAECRTYFDPLVDIDSPYITIAADHIVTDWGGDGGKERIDCEEGICLPTDRRPPFVIDDERPGVYAIINKATWVATCQ